MTRVRWHKHICVICKNEFESSRYDTKTCGANCRKERSRRVERVYKERDEIERGINRLAAKLDDEQIGGASRECLEWLQSVIEARLSVTAAAVTQSKLLK